MEQQLHILEEMEGLTCEKVRLGSESVFRLTLERDGEVRVYTLTVTRGIRLNLESRRKTGEGARVRGYETTRVGG